MKNKIIIMFAVFLCGLFFEGSSFAADSPKKIILLDPGHGGVDGGAVANDGTLEKGINLSIGLKLKDKLEKSGFSVVMTRDSDKGLYSDSSKKKKAEDLRNRCKLKIQSGCDVFMSIHLNMFPQSKYYGAQVWYASDENSKKLAHIIQENFRKDVDSTNKRVEKEAKGAYKVLRCSSMPSVIVECGFLSNPTEEQKLKTESYQENIADSLSKSVSDYFKIEEK